MITYAMVGVMMPYHGVHKRYTDLLTDEEKEDIKKVYDQKAIMIKKERGMREFEVEGVVVLALNHRNALRKAKNMKEKIREITK
jgi:hypothetical protein